MNKEELVERAAARSGQRKAVVESVIEGVMAAVEEALGAGDDVRLAGFGTWRVREWKARVGRNPRTGVAVEVPGGPRVSFTPGKRLKDSVKRPA